ncbi:MAG: methyl-accepting chemotaxis protein [Bacteroidales bacterium]
MKAKSKLKIRGKLVIGFFIIISSIILTLFLSHSNIQKIQNFQVQVITLDSIAYELTSLRADENRTRVLTYDLLISKNENPKKEIKEQISAKEVELLKKVKGVDSLLEAYPQFGAALFTIREDAQTYHKNSHKLINLIDEGKTEEAYLFLSENQSSFYDKIRSESLNLEKEVLLLRNQVFANNVQLIKHTTTELVVMGISLIILTLVLAVIILRTIKNITEELVSGIDILTTSSAGILDTVNEISTGVSETATAVSETTTTIEEVRQTATVANKKAQSLIESSQKAADSADKGKESVVSVADAIKRIDHQMKMISETVVKLSEQNRTIGEITATVSDIADQSNLLAVNAAIEAAKAGEHGRGFTVVAQEIRSLADQSKKATLQVKEILNEINKSVNQTVGVTEQGAKTVENGLILVQQNGEIIDLLAENVEETAQASMQISSSNYQQMAGMDQIVPAMENIKKASEQNIKGIQLAQTASQGINNLSKALKNVIAKYDL